MDSDKKLTISNKEQIHLLVDKMEQNSAIARGQRTLLGQSKQDIDVFWEQLSNGLNSLGPPVRKRQDWQRVWTNYKQNLRRKMSNNRQNVETTEGGPYEVVPLTALEKRVANILNTKAVVSPAGKIFGVDVEVNVDDENAHPPSSPSLPHRSSRSRIPQVGKLSKVNAIEEQTRNQVQIIKKLDAIKKFCYKNYKINKKILQIKKHKLQLLQKKEEDEAKIRKFDIQLKQNMLHKAQLEHA